MKLIVTGGAGFIGSNFIRHIFSKYPNYEIVNLDLLTYAGGLDNLKDVDSRHNYEFIKGDIGDKDLTDKLAKQADIIVNFAAETHVDRSISNSFDFINTNVVGTHNLLESAKNNNKIRFHHISTDEVYGHLGLEDDPFNESTKYDPRSPYSASKAASDHLVMSYYHTYGLPVTISNCSNNYGPYQFPEKLHALFITNLLEGKKVPLYGDGLNIRDWLFVEDHCEAIDRIIHHGRIGETYCIGGGCEKTNLEVVYEILKLLGMNDNMIEYINDRPGHDRRYAMSYKKMKQELEWKPNTDFSNGMIKTVEWYKKNQEWWMKRKSNIK
ncbi:MAG: dTDP-glucose 4,6-dehydratase [bacterium]